MGFNILLVDDEETIRFAFSELLSRDGHDVTTADSYEAAIDTLSGNEFDLIITDILLGGHTGVDLLRQVKDRRLTCPVIMITGEPNIKTAMEAVRLGAFDYIPKPVEKETLLKTARLALPMVVCLQNAYSSVPICLSWVVRQHGESILTGKSAGRCF